MRVSSAPRPVTLRLYEWDPSQRFDEDRRATGLVSMPPSSRLIAETEFKYPSLAPVGNFTLPEARKYPPVFFFSHELSFSFFLLLVS